MAKTQCPECESKYTIKSARIEKILGKTVTCKVCSSRFIVKLLPAAIEPIIDNIDGNENNDSDEQQSSTITKKRRRTQAEVRQEYIIQLAERFREYHPALVEIDQAEKVSVVAVRDWIYQVLLNCLGYSEQDIVTDIVYGESRIDMLVHENPKDPPQLLFNIMNTRRALNQKVVDKVKNDTFLLGVPFAVVTNGSIWRFFRADKLDGENRFVEVANIPILDEDGVSDTDAEELYLLSKRALQRGDTEKTSHQIAALQPHRLTKVLFDSVILSKINRILTQNYKAESGVNVNIKPEILQQRIEEILTISNL